METLTFNDFKEERVQDITMEQLRATHIELDAYGNPMKKIRHADFFDNIMQEVQFAGYTPKIMDLFIANGGDSNNPGINRYAEVAKIYGDFSCKAYVVRRVYMNLNLTEFDTNEFTTNLAISYHQGGIQVGFGQNVKICHNQCMLHADQYVATYGDKKYSEARPIDDIINIIRGWLLTARERVQNERDTIHRMQGIDVPIHVFKYLVGELQVLRVRVDSRNKNIKEQGRYYPLSQTQINSFVDRCLGFYASHDKVTLWDIYNCSTYEYSNHNMDIPKILPQNIEMVEFLDGFYHFRGKDANPSTIELRNLQITSQPIHELEYVDAEIIG